MLLRLADWFLAQIPIPRSLFIPIIAFFGNNDIENYEGNGDDDDEENYAFARTAAPSDFLIFVPLRFVFYIQFTICGDATTRSRLLCGSTDLDKLSLPTTLQSKEEGSLPLGSILHVAAVYLDTRLHQTSIPWRSYLSHVRHRGVFSIFVTVSSVLSNISHFLLLILCSNPPSFSSSLISMRIMRILLLFILLLLLIMAVRLWVATVSGARTRLIPCQ